MTSIRFLSKGELEYSRGQKTRQAQTALYRGRNSIEQRNYKHHVSKPRCADQEALLLCSLAIRVLSFAIQYFISDSTTYQPFSFVYSSFQKTYPMIIHPAV